MDDRTEKLYQYLMSQGLLTPEQEKLMRQQEQVNTLREQSMEIPRTRMMGGVAVAPHWTQALGSLAQGISAGYQQKGIDKRMGEMTSDSKRNLDAWVQSMRGPKVMPASNNSYMEGLQQEGMLAAPQSGPQGVYGMTEEELRQAGLLY